MFDFSDLERNLQKLPIELEDKLLKYGNTCAKKLESEAKKNRPWQDRTAHARQRIVGACRKEDGKIRIYLAHGVDYGVYLELANEKRYAVIYPTLRKEAPGIFEGARGLMEKI